MGYSVREASSDADWRQAIAVIQHVYVSGGYTPAENAARFQTRERLEAEGAMLIAVRESGEVLGATILLHVGSAMHQVAQPGEREFRLLGVAPEARGEGVGAALVKECIARCTKEGATALVLWTRPNMLAAQRLYERLGFQRATERDEETPAVSRGWCTGWPSDLEQQLSGGAQDAVRPGVGHEGNRCRTTAQEGDHLLVVLVHVANVHEVLCQHIVTIAQ